MTGSDDAVSKWHQLTQEWELAVEAYETANRRLTKGTQNSSGMQQQVAAARENVARIETEMEALLKEFADTRNPRAGDLKAGFLFGTKLPQALDEDASEDEASDVAKRRR